MTTTYLDKEIIKEAIPIPSPSSVPEQVTETADTINPRLMI